MNDQRLIFLAIAFVVIGIFVSSRWFTTLRERHVTKVRDAFVGAPHVLVEGVAITGAVVSRLDLSNGRMVVTLAVPFSLDEETHKLIEIASLGGDLKADMSVHVGGCSYSSIGVFRDCSILFTANGASGYSLTFHGIDCERKVLYQNGALLTAAPRDHRHVVDQAGRPASVA